MCRRQVGTQRVDHRRKVRGADYVPHEQLIDRNRSGNPFEFVSVNALAVNHIGILPALTRRLIGTVAVHHHFQLRGLLINGFIPLDGVHILPLMLGVGCILPVKEVDFDTCHAKACPFLELGTQNLGVSVAEIRQRIAPYQNLDTGFVRRVHERSKGCVIQPGVPAAIQQHILPAHLLCQSQVLSVKGEIVLPALAVVNQPAPRADTGFYPIIIVNCLFFLGKLVIILGLPVFHIIINLFNQLGLVDRCHITGNANAPRRLKGVFHLVVVNLDACGRVLRAKHTCALSALLHLEEGTIEPAADQPGLGYQRIVFRAGDVIKQGHCNILRIVELTDQVPLICGFVREAVFARRIGNILLCPHGGIRGEGKLCFFVDYRHGAGGSVNAADSVTEGISVIICTHGNIQIKLPCFERNRGFIAGIIHLIGLAGKIGIGTGHFPRAFLMNGGQIEVILLNVKAHLGFADHGLAVFLHGIGHFSVSVQRHHSRNTAVRRGYGPCAFVLQFRIGIIVIVLLFAGRQPERRTQAHQHGKEQRQNSFFHSILLKTPDPLPASTVPWFLRERPLSWRSRRSGTG